VLHDVVGALGGNMVIRDQAELRQMLEVERERLKLVLRHGESSATESIGYGNHMADDATEAFEQARDMSLRARLGDTLIDVEEALHKFDLGSYGICEGCGINIDWARLEAKPAARLCIKCQRRSDFGR
jgi:DnaK suppressor protein